MLKTHFFASLCLSVSLALASGCGGSGETEVIEASDAQAIADYEAEQATLQAEMEAVPADGNRQGK